MSMITGEIASLAVLPAYITLTL